MSEYWDLACVTCGGVRGQVVHWNHGGEELAAIAKVLPTIAALARAAAELPPLVDLELRIGRPEWQSGLLAYAVAHDGHDVRAASEYGSYFGECAEWIRGAERYAPCRLASGHDGDHDTSTASAPPGPVWQSVST